MAERLGVRAAARAAGLGTNHVALYVAVARQSLKADVIDGQLFFDAGELRLWRERLDTERAAREQNAKARQDAAFRRANPKHCSGGVGSRVGRIGSAGRLGLAKPK